MDGHLFLQAIEAPLDRIRVNRRQTRGAVAVAWFPWSLLHLLRLLPFLFGGQRRCPSPNSVRNQVVDQSALIRRESRPMIVMDVF